MRRRTGRIWWTTVCVGLLTGCGQQHVRPPYPPDPLLVAKKPSAVKPEKAEPVQVAINEPEPPAISDRALASAPPTLQQSFSFALQSVPPSKPTPEAVPVSRPRQPE